MFYIYIIKSKSYKWYYVGSTQNVEKRLQMHNSKQVSSTKFRAPYEVVYKDEFETVDLARKREKAIKQSRSVKEEIIKNLAPSSNG